MGGSDPTFSASSRPKSSWGRSRPRNGGKNLGMATALQLGRVVDSAPVTSSSPSIERNIMPRRRFQSGRVYQRGTRWVGSYRDYEANPQTGKRTRPTITYDTAFTSDRAAKAARTPYLDEYNPSADEDP